jgi:hypothetical protein
MCVNILELEGDAEVLRTVRDNFTLQAIFPCPEDYYQTEEWKAWCLENWGVEEDVADLNAQWKEDGRLVLEFRTVGGAPLPALDALANQHPFLDIALKYVDHENQVYGEAVWDDGERVVDVAYGFEHEEDITDPEARDFFDASDSD